MRRDLTDRYWPFCDGRHERERTTRLHPEAVGQARSLLLDVAIFLSAEKPPMGRRHISRPSGRTTSARWRMRGFQALSRRA